MPRISDERNETDVADAVRAQKRKRLPDSGHGFAQAIRDVSCERGFALVHGVAGVRMPRAACCWPEISARLDRVAKYPSKRSRGIEIAISGASHSLSPNHIRFSFANSSVSARVKRI